MGLLEESGEKPFSFLFEPEASFAYAHSALAADKNDQNDPMTKMTPMTQ